MENKETKINENKKLRELTEEELRQVNGGVTEQELLQRTEEQLRKQSQQKQKEIIDEMNKQQQIEPELP